MKIWLLKHPVEAGQKEEAKALGVRIIDKKFADQYDPSDLYEPQKKTRAKRNKKGE